MSEATLGQTGQASPAVIRTPDQRLRVFISSTMKELAPEREAARQAIAELRLIPILFETGARPHPPRNLYRAYLAQSHIFIGIYWERYGWVAPGMNISGLEDEFRLAHNFPKLIYIKTPAPNQEPELKALLQQIKDNEDTSYKYFSETTELSELISNDLILLLTEQFEQAQLSSPSFAAPLLNQPNRHHTLPHPITSLIGREADVTTVTNLLTQPGIRLITLTGSGGVGKTRLSLAVAAGLANQFEDGIYWINLAAIRQPDLVISAIAQALDVWERGGHPLLQSLQAYLWEKHLLLLLDNFEQVTSAAPLLSELLETAPNLKLLVTSRVPLHLRGEHEFPVQPLSVPAAFPQEEEPVPETAAVRLFVERAQAARPDFVLTRENSHDVARIVQRLDGLPLAIELTAARLKLLPPRLILDRLNDSLQFLTGGAQDLPPRQQTMRNVIHWSYELLSPPNKTLFSRLGVFADGFTLDAAETICRLNDDLDIFEGIATLLDNSLLQTGPAVDDQPRFTMLKTVREYAYERLQASDESELVQQQHARFFANYAQAAWAGITSRDNERWLDRLNADIGNFRAVLDWGQASPQFWPLTWPLIPNLVWFAYRRGYLHEAHRWCEQAIAQTASLGDDPLRAFILVQAGTVAMWQSDLAAATRLMDEGLLMMRRVGETVGLPDALFPRGVLAVNKGDGERAQKLFAEALPLFEATGHTWFQAMIHLHLGNVCFSQENLVQAQSYTQTARALGQQFDAPWVVASALNNFGELARYREDYDTAEKFYLESKNLFQQINASPDIARANHSLGWVKLARGHHKQARSLFVEAMALHEQLGIKRGVAECLSGLAAIMAAEGATTTAVTLFAAVRARFKHLGTDLWPADNHDMERHLALAHAQLGEATFNTAWEQGQTIPFDQALAQMN